MIKPSGEAKWSGPCMQKKIPSDPWGGDYICRAPGQTTEFNLLSHGKDGQAGGAISEVMFRQYSQAMESMPLLVRANGAVARKGLLRSQEVTWAARARGSKQIRRD